MSTYRGTLATVPGRVTVRVPVPNALLVEADKLASERSIDRAVVLGDLVAEALPDALADAARDLLAPHLLPSRTKPRPEPGFAHDLAPTISLPATVAALAPDQEHGCRDDD